LQEIYGNITASPSKPKTKPQPSNNEEPSVATVTNDAPPPAYSLVLSSELFGENVEIRRRPDNKVESTARMLIYKTPRKQDSSPYSLSPISQRSQNLLKSPPKTPRKIPASPTRVLEAPSIKDDFYLNLIDWSSQNILAVGLGTCVYLWNAGTGQVSISNLMYR